MNLTVGKKIALVCGCILCLAAVQGAVSLITGARTAGAVEMVTADSLPCIIGLAEINGAAKDLRTQASLYLSASTAQERSAIETRVAELGAKLQAEMKKYAPGVTDPEDKANFEKLKTVEQRYLRTWEKMITLGAQGKQAEVASVLKSELLPVIEEQSRVLAAMDDFNRKETDQRMSLAAESIAQGKLWVAIMVGAAIAVGIALAFFLIRATNRALCQAATELREGAEQVSSASGQVSASSQSLAQGASEQAASLEQTSASTEEITSMTRKNAENSRSAATLMKNASELVMAANHNLEQMVGSMQEINTSSDKIAKIIKVIDEISFQTNILALNAAVEAARAGEAGMGFAVVADEVRNLAQRCAQAAKDTTGLIEESITNSNDGKSKLDLVAKAIHDITDNVTQVKTLVDEVNLGSEEQSRGIEQIAKAIAQMEQVTQKTAASAEQSASASEELNAQAVSMSDVVVRLNEMVGASSRSASSVPDRTGGGLERTSRT
ncbi:MAG TPA: methyl-accepting chemotaxis protein [Bryobacteraceae bacterium]|nr:methyl-accepting chemotaxis protein [Bryobacteraceae bacterium]